MASHCLDQIQGYIVFVVQLFLLWNLLYFFIYHILFIIILFRLGHKIICSITVSSAPKACLGHSTMRHHRLTPQMSISYLALTHFILKPFSASRKQYPLATAKKHKGTMSLWIPERPGTYVLSSIVAHANSQKRRAIKVQIYTITSLYAFAHAVIMLLRQSGGNENERTKLSFFDRALHSFQRIPRCAHSFDHSSVVRKA